MNKIFLGFVLIVLPYLFLQVDSQCEKKYKNRGCFCKNTTLRTLEEYESQKREIIDHIWEAGLRNWSPLAQIFRNQLQELLDYDDEEIFGFAERSILFIAIYNPFMDKFPSACATAQIINSSISCLQGDNAPIVDVIENGLINPFYENIISLVHWGSINSVDCPVLENKFNYSQVPTWECEGNGFVYDFETAWDLKGYMIPRRVRNTVRRLYKSNDYRDKYIANTATYVLQDFVIKVRNGFDSQSLFEFLNLQFGSPYPKCCCAERQARMDYLFNYHNEQRVIGMKILADVYRSTDACVPQEYNL